MTEAWVVNASPLILFGRIGRLDLIERLAPALLVPIAVIEEVRHGELRDNTAGAALNWAARHQVANIEVPTSIERWDLGAGEVVRVPGPLLSLVTGDRHLAVRYVSTFKFSGDATNPPPSSPR